MIVRVPRILWPARKSVMHDHPASQVATLLMPMSNSASPAETEEQREGWPDGLAPAGPAENVSDASKVWWN
jgi:hypothetical protein